MAGVNAEPGDHADPTKAIVMAHTTANNHRGARLNGLAPGRAYFVQFRIVDTGPSKYIFFGVATSKYDFTTVGTYPGLDGAGESWGVYLSDNTKRYKGAVAGQLGTRSGGWSNGDKVGMLIDLREPSPSFTIYKNDDALATGTLGTMSIQFPRKFLSHLFLSAFLLPSNTTIFPMVNLYEQASKVEVIDLTNPFGQQ
jgi:hypothetical protein